MIRPKWMPSRSFIVLRSDGDHLGIALKFGWRERDRQRLDRSSPTGRHSSAPVPDPTERTITSTLAVGWRVSTSEVGDRHFPRRSARNRSCPSATMVSPSRSRRIAGHPCWWSTDCRRQPARRRCRHRQPRPPRPGSPACHRLRRRPRRRPRPRCAGSRHFEVPSASRSFGALTNTRCGTYQLSRSKKSVTRRFQPVQAHRRPTRTAVALGLRRRCGGHADSVLRRAGEHHVSSGW